MFKLKIVVFAAFKVAVFTSVLIFVLSTTLAFAQFRTVTVQNANNNPVPTNVVSMPPVTVNGPVETNISNTPNVNIANTPTVNATISGTPAVSATITGTPSVTVSGTAKVSVANLPMGTAGPGPATGLLVKSLHNPAEQPYAQSVSYDTTGSASRSCQASFTVPAGKVLVIEYLQLSAFKRAGGNPSYLLLAASSSGLD